MTSQLYTVVETTTPPLPKSNPKTLLIIVIYYYTIGLYRELGLAALEMRFAKWEYFLFLHYWQISDTTICIYQNV